jgi:hypothetical protein
MLALVLGTKLSSSVSDSALQSFASYQPKIKGGPPTLDEVINLSLLRILINVGWKIFFLDISYRYSAHSWLQPFVINFHYCDWLAPSLPTVAAFGARISALIFFNITVFCFNLWMI